MKRLRENLSTSSRYAAADALANSRNYAVGLTTVLIVVCFVALLQNAVVRSSSVFVRLSETQVSEMDILLTPDLAALQADSSESASSSPLPPFWLNETHVRQTLASNPRVAGSSPRWTLLAKSLNPADARLNSSVIVLISDTIRETEIGLGRTWTRRPLRWDETYVSAALLRTLNITAGRGNKIRLQLDLLQVIPGFDFADFLPALYEAFENLLETTASFNGTVNVNQTLQALGLSVPEDLCVGGNTINASDISLSLLCSDNGTAFGVDLSSPVFIPVLNVSLPLDQACALAPGNVTIELGNVNITQVCVGDDFDLNAVPAAQLPLFFQEFSLPVFEDLVGPQLGDLLSLRADLTVLESVGNPDGKWPSALGNVLALEMSETPELLRQMLPTNNLFVSTLLQAIDTSSQPSNGLVNISSGNLTLVDSISTLNSILSALDSLTPQNMAEYALLVVVMLKERYNIYLQAPKKVAADFVELNNEIFNALGYRFAAIPNNGVQVALEGILFIKLFLDQIFGSVMAVLIVLGAFLIYSLLIGNVSDKTYEYGMLRALGFERNSLIGLLFVTALFFTLPGIGFGLLGAWLLWVPLSLVFQLLTSAPADYSLHWSAVVLGVLVGLVMPLVANLGPIKRALSRTLRDSLDIYHNVQNETTVKMIKLRDMGFRPVSFVVSIVVVALGVLVYYLIPYSFIYEDYPLFLGILQVMLLSMVLALCLIAATMQPFLERVVLWCLVWGPDRRMSSLMEKNLSAHRSRNEKTALMFIISLGFIIFAGASFSLQAATVGNSLRIFIGADGNVFAPSWSSPLPEADFRSVLEAELQRNGTLLLEYSFATFHLRRNPRVTETRIANLAAEPTRTINIRGIDSSHLGVVFNEFYVPTEWSRQVRYNKSVAGYPDTVESLYSAKQQQFLSFERSPGFQIPESYFAYEASAAFDSRTETQFYTEYMDVIISEALRLDASLDTDTPLRFEFQVRDNENRLQNVYYYAKARALVQKIPGFFISAYQITADRSPLFVSMDSFVNITNTLDAIMLGTEQPDSDPYTPVNGVPRKENLWFRLKAGATARDVDDLFDKLRNFITDDSIQTINVKGLVDATRTAQNAMLIFFNVVAIINAALSFFLLWISFDANVRFNGWEVGVLRSIGVSSTQVTRVYVYEALAVVLTAVSLGTLVGIIVSVVLTAQFGLFLELPFVFYFPAPLFAVVLILSIILAVVGAFIPANQFARKSISNVLRGQE